MFMEMYWLINLQNLTHKGIIAGKLKGVIPAQTPSGVRNDRVSISLAMFGIVSPNCRLVTLQQCSTTSVNGKEELSIVNTKW